MSHTMVKDYFPYKTSKKSKMSAFDTFQHCTGSHCKHWTVYNTFKFMAYELHLKKFLKFKTKSEINYTFSFTSC